MSRDDGFAIGDRSTRTLYDVRLVRATRKVGLAAVVAWDAVVDASWEAGCRVPFADAVDILPYDLGDTSVLLEALRHEGLLDDDGRIRAVSWDGWFGVASERREVRRRSGALGGLRAGGLRTIEEALALLLARDTDATASVERPKTVAIPVPSVPTVPSYPSVPSSREVNGAKPGKNGLEAVRDVVARIPFSPAPKPGKRPS